MERYDKQVRHLHKLVRISDQSQKTLQDLNKTLKIASLHDPLTNLPNRRLMMERLEVEAAAVSRGRRAFSLAVLDVDRFKALNDDSGHETGDIALIAIAGAIKHSLRAYDICARWGGEEFIILLPETLSEEALEISERLRDRIHALQLPDFPELAAVAVSIGVAQHSPEGSYRKTIKRADDAMYRAKREGRNRALLAE